ncbi:hypothetical protein GCM10027414_05780 [Humibacter ginsengiterrae]
MTVAASENGSAPWVVAGALWGSGEWSAELDGAGIAGVRFRDTLVLTGVRAVVRDHDWNTCALEVDAKEQIGSSLRLTLRCPEPGVQLEGSLEFDASGRALSVALDLTVGSDFETNRVGLVVLHSASLSGTELTVEHTDGSVQRTAFPVAVSPHQPVFDIATLAWRAGDLDAALRFDGDVFEMEDQRNWTDASFKTYSRPLALPFPYLLGAGSRVRQTVRLEVEEGSPQRAVATVGPHSSSRDRIVLDADGTFPAIGLGASTAPDPAPRANVPIGSFRVVELDLATPNWPAALDRAASSGLPLDARIVLDDDHPHSLDDAARMLAGLRLVRVAAFNRAGPARHVSDAPAVAALRDALAQAGVSSPVVGGARSHFTELNRERHRLPRDLDGVVFATTPLFHELGTRQLVRSLAMQRIVAAQAVAENADAPVHVGPVTLRPRFNDVATSPQPHATGTTLRDGYGAQFAHADDPRQTAPELAAWTIASAAALAVPGVASLTYYEEWGPRGITDAGGTEYPVAAAVRSLAELSGAQLLHGDSADGLIWAIGARSGERETLLVANLDDRRREVAVVTDSASTSVVVDAGSWRTAG